LPRAPSTDPGERSYRTGLLPWILTRRRWSGYGWSFFAACRILSSSLGQSGAALCPIDWFCRRRLSLAKPLPSTPVTGLRRYYGPVRLPVSVHRRRSPVDSRRGRRHSPPSDMGPPSSCDRCFGACLGSSTTRSPLAPRARDACGVAFRGREPRRHSDLSYRFRGSIPSPHVPLSTLRRHPCGRRHASLTLQTPDGVFGTQSVPPGKPVKDTRQGQALTQATCGGNHCSGFLER